MSPPPQSPGSPHIRAGWLIPLALVCALALFPPETRGESMAGCAALVALLAALGWSRSPGAASSAPLVLGLVGFFPLLRTAMAPGAAVEPLAVILVAYAAGLYTAAVPGRNDRHALALPLALTAVGCVVAAHGLYQSLWGLEALARKIEAGGQVADRTAVLARLRAGRAFANFPTPAALGGFLVLALPTTVGAALAVAGRRRWLLHGALAVQAGALLAAASATAVAALAGAAALLGLVDARQRRRVLAALGVAAVVLVAVVSLRGSELLDPDDPGSPWRLRAANFRIAVEMIGDRPWLGVGPGGFGEMYPGYRRPGDNEAQHAHNLPLEWCAEWGVPLGLLLSGAFFVFFLGPLLRSAPRQAPWRRGLAVGLAALALQGLADFTVLLPSLLWLGATARGWLAEPLLPAERPAPRLRVAPVVALVATLTAAVLAALAGLGWNDRAEARQLHAAGDPARAAERARRATTLTPWDPDAWLMLGESSLAADQRRDAATLERLSAVAERAVARSPVRPAARAHRARVRLLAGDLPGAYADAREAARLYPHRGEYTRLRDTLAGRFAHEAAGGAAP